MFGLVLSAYLHLIVQKIITRICLQKQLDYKFTIGQLQDYYYCVWIHRFPVDNIEVERRYKNRLKNVVKLKSLDANSPLLCDKEASGLHTVLSTTDTSVIP